MTRMRTTIFFLIFFNWLEDNFEYRNHHDEDNDDEVGHDNGDHDNHEEIR